LRPKNIRPPERAAALRCRTVPQSKIRAVAGAVAASACVLGLAGSASAAPPALTAVGERARHPTATFQAPRAGTAVVYLASKPDRATDGSFLSENVRDADVLTTDEIQAGSWLGETQVDPGTYYVMLHASADFDACWIVAEGRLDPACADGYSNVLTLVVKKPTVRYAARVAVYRYSREASLTLTARPLGEKIPYRACWRTRSGKRRCVRGTLVGYSWGSPAEDTVTVGTRGLRAVTVFSWYVGGKRVAARRVRVR